MSEIYKAAAKAIKAKGLQKLRFWCELCHKQCRDACGYRNHCTTEGHLRQVKLFSQNSNCLISQYSKEFERAFMNLVRRKYRNNTVLAKRVYNEFIQDREHVHMNSTRWVTLTAFVYYLDRTSKVQVSESEQGLLIRYIDRDPAREAQQEAIRKREKSEMNEEDRRDRDMVKQLKCYQNTVVEAQPTKTNTDSADPHSTIKLHLKTNRKSIPFSTKSNPAPIQVEVQSLPAVSQCPVDSVGYYQNAFHLADQHCEQEGKENIDNSWLHPNIVVRIINKTMADGNFYNQKARILRLVDSYVGIVKLLQSPRKIKIDQADLETVIPTIGHDVLVLDGTYRGEIATIRKLDNKEQCATLTLRTKEGTIREIQKCYAHISEVFKENV